MEIEYVDIYKIIRHNIKKYRKEKGITQAKLAELTDLSHDYIRQIESDKVANTFSVQTLYDISQALGVDIGLLFQKDDVNNSITN
ncbi:MAG: helix-turn-helix transcriptional regulator [Erysipelotrichaceae bacterium]|nr:helix-turn-helix transcriptional regulator [Erysipelotrichaceae bacterium]